MPKLLKRFYWFLLKNLRSFVQNLWLTHSWLRMIGLDLIRIKDKPFLRDPLFYLLFTCFKTFKWLINEVIKDFYYLVRSGQNSLNPTNSVRLKPDLGILGTKTKVQFWHRSRNFFFRNRNGNSYGNVKKNLPIWVSVPVLDLSQNSGFCRTLPKKKKIWNVPVQIRNRH